MADPQEGRLLVSLGAHTEPGGEGKPAKLRERLVLVSAESLAPAAVAAEPVAMPAAVADPGVRPALFAPMVPAPLGISVPAAHIVAPIPPPRAIGLPAPPMPERAIPQPILPDGTPAPLPPLPDDQTRPASMEPPTAVPMPSPQNEKGAAKLDAKEVWPLTLQDAIKIGLENSKLARVVETSKEGSSRDCPLVIEPVEGDQDIEIFREKSMEEARTIGRQYWASPCVMSLYLSGKCSWGWPRMLSKSRRRDRCRRIFLKPIRWSKNSASNWSRRPGT